MRNRSLALLPFFFLFFFYKCSDNISTPLNGSSPADGATGVSVSTSLSVTFNKRINPSTVTTNTSNTSCSGTVQLSLNNFSTCVQMSSNPTASNDNKTFTVKPSSNLDLSTTYTLKLTGEIKDEEGNSNPSTTISFTTANTVFPTDMIFWITASGHNGNFASDGGGNARTGADLFCNNDANKPTGFSNYHALLEISRNDNITQMYDNFSFTNGRIMHLGGLVKLWDNFTYMDNGTYSENAPYSSDADNITWLGRATKGDGCFTLDSRDISIHCENWSSNSGAPKKGAILNPYGLGGALGGGNGAMCAPLAGSEEACSNENKIACIAIP